MILGRWGETGVTNEAWVSSLNNQMTGGYIHPFTEAEDPGRVAGLGSSKSVPFWSSSTEDPMRYPSKDVKEDSKKKWAGAFGVILPLLYMWVREDEERLTRGTRI